MPEKKIYSATLRLGVETDTLDLTGRVVRTSPVPDLRPETIRKSAAEFVGNIEQTPPMYSAVRHGGVRAYKLARKGREVALKKRRVTVHSLRISAVRLPDITMEIRCSSGTYIRSLAADLGQALGTGSHLRTLRRLGSGFFKVQDALSSGKISNGRFRGLLRNRVIPLGTALSGMEEIQTNQVLAKEVRHGYQPALEAIADANDLMDRDGDYYVKLMTHDELVAVVSVNMSRRDGHGRLKIVRVFY